MAQMKTDFFVFNRRKSATSVGRTVSQKRVILKLMPRALIIDDDPDMAELLGHMLDLLEYEHDYAPNGVGALDVCRKTRYDVIILDVMLEDTNGWVIYRELERVTDVPIVFITAWRTGENRLRAESLRADGFISKPISHQDFADQMHSVIGHPARRLSMPQP
jgi:two-component system OmpR family response regulator